MKKILTLFALVATAQLFASPLWMRYPKISPDGSKIAFCYQGDIFIVNSNGGNALQVTSHVAHDFQPIWSNDSKSLAFASNRHGNFDVFTISSEGGVPERLTFHSSSDIPYAYSPDGGQILFQSLRLDHPDYAQFPYARLNELYEVPVKGGRVKQYLTIAADDINFSKDGKQILFHNKKGYEDNWRKHHTSSVTRDIILYDISKKTFKQITDQPCEDRNPVWIDGSNFYFLSERSGCFNIWKGSLDNPYGTHITDYKNHPVRFLSISENGTLCYGYDGEIYTYDGSNSKKVNIDLRHDNTENNTVVKKVKFAGDFAVSPNGKEVAFVYHGEVFVSSMDYATTKRITNTPEQERSVNWSPDGETLIYAGERNNSWNIYMTSHDREGEKYFYNSTLIKEEEIINNGEETFQPVFSPNGEEIAFLENRTTLKVYNLKSKKSRLVMPGSYSYSYSDGDQYFAWSPDSKWIAVEFFDNERWSSDIGLVKATGEEKPINITGSGYGCGRPKFAMDGAMIYYGTDKYGYRSHGSWGSQGDIEAVFLTEEAYQKFKLTEEEYALWQEDQKENKPKKDDEEDKDKYKEKDKDNSKEVEPIQIEFDGLEDRKERLTIHSSFYSDFLVNNEGTTLYYLARFEKGYNIWSTKFKEKETKMLAEINSGGSTVEFNEKEDQIFVAAKGTLMKVDTKSGKPEPVSIDAEITVDAAGERAYMFEHAWRQVREKFYVEDIHGVDWDQYKKDYQKFLPHITTGFDFAEMLSELLGELNASHTGARYGEYDPMGDQTAMLGCYYDEGFKGDGLKIMEILPKSPLITSSGKIKAGVIIEKVDGTAIKEGENYIALFNRKIGERVLLSLYDPKTKERWDEVVRPISQRDEIELAYIRWVKRCEQNVEEWSNGELGYVHIKGMNSASFRVLFEKALGKYHTKKALIVDTRFNGGGWLHDDLATFLSGKRYMSFEPRGQKNMGGEPIWKWQKPSCVLMSEGNYSDAHLFPYTYKALGIGKLIGMPVPGTGTAVWWEQMVDGQTVFGIPEVGMRSESEGFLVENHDLEPDIKVNNDFEEMIKGNDQQLRAAVEELMK